MTLSDVISKRTVFGKDAFLTGSVTAKSAIVTDNSSSDAVRITQTGSGNALVVEDSTNPDSTPFVVTADGDIGIGASTPSVKLEIRQAGNPEARITSSTSQNPAISLNRPAGNSYQITNELGVFKLQSASPGIDSVKTDLIDSVPNIRFSILENTGIQTLNPQSALHIQGDLTMTTATTATGATAGTSGAIPAQVAGYLVVSINGTSRKIPYYAT